MSSRSSSDLHFLNNFLFPFGDLHTANFPSFQQLKHFSVIKIAFTTLSNPHFNFPSGTQEPPNSSSIDIFFSLRKLRTKGKDLSSIIHDNQSFSQYFIVLMLLSGGKKLVSYPLSSAFFWMFHINYSVAKAITKLHFLSEAYENIFFLLFTSRWHTKKVEIFFFFILRWEKLRILRSFHASLFLSRHFLLPLQPCLRNRSLKLPHEATFFPFQFRKNVVRRNESKKAPFVLARRHERILSSIFCINTKRFSLWTIVGGLNYVKNISLKVSRIC